MNSEYTPPDTTVLHSTDGKVTTIHPHSNLTTVFNPYVALSLHHETIEQEHLSNSPCVNDPTPIDHNNMFNTSCNPKTTTQSMSDPHNHPSTFYNPQTLEGGLHRVEQDSFGPITIPKSALWSTSTQRCLNHFSISPNLDFIKQMYQNNPPKVFILTLLLVKKAVCLTHLRVQRGLQQKELERKHSNEVAMMKNNESMMNVEQSTPIVEKNMNIEQNREIMNDQEDELHQKRLEQRQKTDSVLQHQKELNERRKEQLPHVESPLVSEQTHSQKSKSMEHQGYDRLDRNQNKSNDEMLEKNSKDFIKHQFERHRHQAHLHPHQPQPQPDTHHVQSQPHQNTQNVTNSIPEIIPLYKLKSILWAIEHLIHTPHLLNDHFPLSLIQTGSLTHFHMNINEVLSTISNQVITDCIQYNYQMGHCERTVDTLVITEMDKMKHNRQMNKNISNHQHSSSTLEQTNEEEMMGLVVQQDDPNAYRGWDDMETTSSQQQQHQMTEKSPKKVEKKLNFDVTKANSVDSVTFYPLTAEYRLLLLDMFNILPPNQRNSLLKVLFASKFSSISSNFDELTEENCKNVCIMTDSMICDDIKHTHTHHDHPQPRAQPTQSHQQQQPNSHQKSQLPQSTPIMSTPQQQEIHDESSAPPSPFVFPISPENNNNFKTSKISHNISQTPPLTSSLIFSHIQKVDPNDDVNACQSTNCVIPTTTRLTMIFSTQNLLEKINFLTNTLQNLAETDDNRRDVIKLGRTHGQVATPIRLYDEIMAFYYQFSSLYRQISNFIPNLNVLPLGGTAVGTGVNSYEGFDTMVCDELARLTGLELISTTRPIISPYLNESDGMNLFNDTNNVFNTQNTTLPLPSTSTTPFSPTNLYKMTHQPLNPAKRLNTTSSNNDVNETTLSRRYSNKNLQEGGINTDSDGVPIDHHLHESHCMESSPTNQKNEQNMNNTMKNNENNQNILPISTQSLQSPIPPCVTYPHTTKTYNTMTQLQYGQRITSKYELMSSLNDEVILSSHLSTLASCLSKMSQDIRFLSSPGSGSSGTELLDDSYTTEHEHHQNTPSTHHNLQNSSSKQVNNPGSSQISFKDPQNDPYLNDPKNFKTNPLSNEVLDSCPEEHRHTLIGADQDHIDQYYREHENHQQNQQKVEKTEVDDNNLLHRLFLEPEYRLKQLESGSSIMPNKSNPTQIEQMLMTCQRVIANHFILLQSNSLGQFQFNAMRPSVLTALLESIELLTHSIDIFTTHCLSLITFNTKIMDAVLNHSLMISTLLTPILGYKYISNVVKQCVEKKCHLWDVLQKDGYCVSKRDFFEKFLKNRDLLVSPTPLHDFVSQRQARIESFELNLVANQNSLERSGSVPQKPISTETLFVQGLPTPPIDKEYDYTKYKLSQNTSTSHSSRPQLNSHEQSVNQQSTSNIDNVKPTNQDPNHRSHELKEKFFQQQFRAREGRFKRNPFEQSETGNVDSSMGNTHLDQDDGKVDQ